MKFVIGIILVILPSIIFYMFFKNGQKSFIIEELQEILPRGTSYKNRYTRSKNLFLISTVSILFLDSAIMKHLLGFNSIITAVLMGVFLFLSLSFSDDILTSNERDKLRYVEHDKMIKSALRDFYSIKHANFLISIISEVKNRDKYETKRLKIYTHNRGGIEEELIYFINLHLSNSDNPYVVKSIESLLLQKENYECLVYILNVISNSEHYKYLDTFEGEDYRKEILKDLERINSEISSTASKAKTLLNKTEKNRIKTELDALKSNRFDKIEEISFERKETKNGEDI